MGMGLIYGALGGLGRGIYEVNKMEAEQQDRLQQMEAQRVGLRQLERDRAALAEELRQKRSAAITNAAEARGGGNRVLADEAARYDGSFGQLVEMDRQAERDAKGDAHVAFTERMAEKNFGLAAGSSARAAESAGIQNEAARLQLAESKSLQSAKAKFRALMEAGDEAGALRVAKAFGIAQPGAQIGRYQFRSEEGEDGRKVTAIFDSTTGLRVGDSQSTAPKATGDINWAKYKGGRQ